MKNHALWMAIGCILPLLLIFVWPVIGISGGLFLFIFIILMLGCHLLMMGGHRRKHSKHDEERERVHGQKKGTLC